MGSTITRRHLPALTLTIGNLLFLSAAVVAQPLITPKFRPHLDISRLSDNFKIDGRLDDNGWKSAAHVRDFFEISPGNNVAPEVRTDACIAYDNDRLLVAFVCHDSPKQLHATMTQRDNISDDDAVALMLDTYGNAAWAYQLYVNPYGIQMDYLWSPLIGPDASYDLIWESAAQITDSGYQVEKAIPFSSLRFPDADKQTWKINFVRYRPRESRQQLSWAAIDGNERCYPCQWGTSTGISEVHPGKGLAILPAFVGHKSDSLINRYDPYSAFQKNSPRGELSLGMKYAASSDVTMEGAYNPDFSQIESDATQISANSTISLMYPERRPFFQEGSDIFRTLFNSFYSRMIYNPEFTAKLVARPGKTSIGFLAARDENSPYMIPLDQGNYLYDVGKSTINILRGVQRFGDNSQIGIILTDRRFDGGGSGTIYALDGDYRFWKSYNISWQLIGCHTIEPQKTIVPGEIGAITFDSGRRTVGFDGESYSGTALIANFSRSSRTLDFNLTYSQLTPTYRTQTGYDPVNNHRTIESEISYTFHPMGKVVVSWGPRLYLSRRWDFTNGTRREDNLFASLIGQLRLAQTQIELDYFRATKIYAGKEFPGLWSLTLSDNSRLNNVLGFGFNFGYGQDLEYAYAVKADAINAGAYVSLKPIDRLTFEPNLNFAKMYDKEPIYGTYFSGFITRTRIRYQATKELSFRLIVQYDDFAYSWDVDPLLTYRLSPFSVFYVGSSYNVNNLAVNPETSALWKLASRQYFMKIQYMIQS